MLRSILLVPCLLISLACATPFPVENLEEGMTPLAVRHAVGEPRFIAPNGVWIFTHEEQNWVGFVVRKDVFLHFNDERLYQWQVTEPVCCGSWGNAGSLNDDWHFRHGHPFGHPGC